MKRFFFLLFPVLSFGPKIFSQTVSQQLYNESQYTQTDQGFDPEFAGKLYAVKYRNTQDSTYTMKKLYRDNGATQLVAKYFYKNGVAQGPFFHYVAGAVSVKGKYENGKLNGDRYSYQNDTLVQEAHFQNGRKTGSWKEYNKQGQLARAVTYDGQENIQSVQVASQPTTTTTPTTQQGAKNQ